MTTLTISQSTFVSSPISENSVMATLQLWMDRHSQRKQLALLADDQLNDMGLTKEAALLEANQPFWK